MDSQTIGSRARRSRGRPPSNNTELIDSELLSGALREFLRNGYGGTSVARIIKSLGISKTTLYSRYASKAELFHAIMSRQIENLSAGAALLSDGERLPLEAGLRAYAVRTLEISLQGDLLHLNRLIYSESYRFPELGIAAAKRMQLGVRTIADFLTECAARDGVPCRNPSDIAAAFIFMLRGWYVNVMLTNEAVSAESVREFADQAVRVLTSSRADW
jgi:TetR/AcrR family transcriptional repressor of mexJK operon